MSDKPCEPSSATAKQSVAWYDKSNGDSEDRVLLLIYKKPYGDNTKGLIKQLLEAYDYEVEENRKLRFMIDNGLGWEDLRNE